MRHALAGLRKDATLLVVCFLNRMWRLGVDIWPTFQFRKRPRLLPWGPFRRYRTPGEWYAAAGQENVRRRFEKEQQDFLVRHGYPRVDVGGE